MRAVWNGAIDRKPAVIALLQQRRTSGHGAEALRFASECVKTVPGDVTVFQTSGGTRRMIEGCGANHQEVHDER